MVTSYNQLTISCRKSNINVNKFFPPRSLLSAPHSAHKEVISDILWFLGDGAAWVSTCYGVQNRLSCMLSIHASHPFVCGSDIVVTELQNSFTQVFLFGDFLLFLHYIYPRAGVTLRIQVLHSVWGFLFCTSFFFLSFSSLPFLLSWSEKMKIPRAGDTRFTWQISQIFVCVCVSERECVFVLTSFEWTYPTILQCSTQSHLWGRRYKLTSPCRCQFSCGPEGWTTKQVRHTQALIWLDKT